MQKTGARAREMMRGIEPQRAPQRRDVQVSSWSVALVLNALRDHAKAGVRPDEIARAYHNAAMGVPGFAGDRRAQWDLCLALRSWSEQLRAELESAGWELP